MLERVAFAALAALVSTAIPVHAATSAPAGATPVGAVPTTAHRRVDLIGTTLPADPRRSDQVVSAIVELAGDTVDERAGRAPFVDERLAEGSVLREQQGNDLALRFAGATVTGRLVHALNAVVVRVRAADLARLEAVAQVEAVQVARRVTRANDLANAATGVPSAWNDLGLTGTGVTVGIVDDGVDYTHADFGGSGLVGDYVANHPGVVEPGTFPTTKVVGGWDFVGDDYDADDPDIDTPQPDPDPLACGLHGTHVAGTAAGFGVDDATGQAYTGGYDAASLAGVTFRVSPGAAPDASLRAYKVFGCGGSSDESVIVSAIDRAVADRVDVLNLSLGQSYGTGSSTDLVVKAVQRASRLGTLVVASAGNSGGAPYLTGTPSTASSALAVAALDTGPTTFPGVTIDTAPAVVGVETNEIPVGGGITGPVRVVVPGCALSDYSGVAGKIVVVSLVDGCVSPVFSALDGVLAVIVIVDEVYRAGYLDVDVPFVMVRAADAAPLLAADGSVVTLSPSAPVPNPEAGMFAGFSSGGPRRGDSVLKPDVTAPGVSLRSAHAGAGTTGIEFSGTSMAAPHVSGIAALVAQAHPTWTPSRIKAVVMTTADPGGVGGYDPLRGGTGVVSAVRATSSVAFASTTDGRHSLGFGLLTLRTASLTRTRWVRITNTSGAAITYDLTAEFTGPTHGAQVTLSPSTVTVRARSSRLVRVRLHFPAASIPGVPAAGLSDAGVLQSVDGLVVATPQVPAPGVYTLRMAFAAVPRALSAVIAPTRVSAASGSGSVRLRNTGKHSGTADVVQWLHRDRTGDSRSSDVPDIRDIGFESFPYDADTQTETGPDRQLVFVVALARAASAHAAAAFVGPVDVDQDDVADFLVAAGDEGLLLDRGANGRFVTLTVDADTLLVVDAFQSEAPYNTSVVYLRTMASSLGAGESSTLGFWVTAASLLIDTLDGDDAPDTATLYVSPFHPRLVAGGLAPVELAPGASVQVPFIADSSEPLSVKGLLVVSPDDPAGLASANAVVVTGL